MRASTSSPSINSSNPRLGKVLDFMRLLWAVDHALQAASKRMETEMSVTAPQRLAVRIIGLMPGVSAGALAEVLHLHPSTLTGVLRRLEERGFVSRQRDPSDGRRALFHLTEEGRKIDGVRAGTVEAAVRRALVGASPRQLAGAKAILRALASELEREFTQDGPS
jgi:MarR family transcriptional regulator, organic hydroperoxide resistance regulator